MLSTFNKIVLNVAIILLIIALIVIGIIIHHSIYGANVKYPPVVGTCPDYWEAIDISNNQTECRNLMDLGDNDNCNYFNTATTITSCDKYRLAKNCGVTWDGITNNDTNRQKCT